MEDGYPPISHLPTPISHGCDDQRPVESGTETVTAIRRHLVSGVLCPLGLDHWRKEWSMDRCADGVGSMRFTLGRRHRLSAVDSAGVCGLDSAHLSDRLGGIPSPVGRYFLSFISPDRAGAEMDRSRPAAAEAAGGEFTLENSGWQNRSGQLSSAKLEP